MSFKQNDTNDNNMIHLGNYEEYFILYMDNELSDEQMKMVDEFLVQHPDLQGEFEMLMSTRLPMEEVNINKNELLSDKMKLSTVDEELLLYIDNELPVEEKKILELELKNNKDYQLQHQLLVRSKLDASDKVIYPYKKELYREEERKVVAFRQWIRVAAAVVVIAVAGVLYFNNSSTPAGIENLASGQETKEQKSTGIKNENKDEDTQTPGSNVELAKVEDKNQEKKDTKPTVPTTRNYSQSPKVVRNDVAKVDQPDQQAIKNQDELQVISTNRTPVIENKSMTNVAIAEIKTPSEIINKNTVTSALANRKTDVVASPKKPDEVVATNKGSVKGFLRKTTRLIEKKTGIDPTNDGELLIGAVAINLN